MLVIANYDLVALVLVLGKDIGNGRHGQPVGGSMVINTATPPMRQQRLRSSQRNDRWMAMHAPPSSEAPRLVSPALIAGEIKKNERKMRSIQD